MLILKLFSLFICFVSLVQESHNARILALYPTPSLSHQVVFWPYTEALAKRGHEIVVITADPAYPKGKAPFNITEIDLHDISYDIWKRDWVVKLSGNTKDQYEIMKGAVTIIAKVIEAQLKTKEVQEILNDKRGFDMLLIEEWTRPTLGFTHVFKVPTISVSSFGSLFGHYADLGVQMHPLLYPILNNQRLHNLNFWEKIYELYKVFWLQYMYFTEEIAENRMLRQILGDDMPPLSELSKNVDLLLLNHHPIWDANRPVPANVIYVGGKRIFPVKPLDNDLQTFLDNSKNGTIYMSLGSNVKPSILPANINKIFLEVFKELPYDVLYKWDLDELPDCPPNVKFSKWFPQTGILNHPKIKLFITQGGLQSTEEALQYKVPLVGIPVLGDQWFNTEKYDYLKIGKRLEMETLKKEDLKNAINTVINDQSYRRNVINLKSLMDDQPMEPIDRAVWWTEHVLRHSNMGKPYRSPRADITWREYLELEVLAVLVISLLLSLTITLFIVYYLITFASKIFDTKFKLKKL